MEYNFNWKSLSAVAGLTLLNFYFRLYPGAVKSQQVVDFLAALRRHIRGPLLVVWDGLPAHRSRLVRDYLASLDGWIQVEYLPPYAPELNPVEYIWAYWKQHELPNVCPPPRISGASVRKPAAPFAACAAVPDSSLPSGSRLRYGRNDSILCGTH